ncbi:ANTAR domain-containing response regulator [Sinorhizobium medicae]|uniref:ANTAR domain-containing response regulator n=1 Tax=Sinorhizobium medicae TaxID=110321 RepID=UPI00037B9D2D|nr:ANTAR domain-containing protein [Sinorhizobium medicae]
MSSVHVTPNFDGWRMLILHRPHRNVDALFAQCARIGAAAEQAWPTFPEARSAEEFDVLLIDADMGHDEQFPWRPGEAPLPLIALIGSEAPGRIAWTIAQGADAQLLKPIGSAGLYSALMVASYSFARRRALDRNVAALKERLARRQELAQATALLMLRKNCRANEAYQHLRLTAMTRRCSIEDVAAAIVEEFANHGLKNADNGR